MIALSTGSLYSYGTARVFELAAEVGYDGVEVIVDNRWDTRQPNYLRRLCADFGLPIVAVHSPFVADVKGWPDDQLGRLRQTVALAQAVGAPIVVAHLPFRFYALVAHWHAYRPRRFFLPVPLPRREPYYRFLDGVNEGLTGLESEAGVTIGMENMPLKRVLGLPVNYYWFNTPDALARFSHLTLDTTHLGTWGLDPLAVYDRLREQVVHVHLSNYDGREHRSPPDGRLPLAEFLRKLARSGYEGAVTVETGPQALDAQDEQQCLAAIRRVLAFCRRHFVE